MTFPESSIMFDISLVYILTSLLAVLINIILVDIFSLNSRIVYLPSFGGFFHSHYVDLFCRNPKAVIRTSFFKKNVTFIWYYINFSGGGAEFHEWGEILCPPPHLNSLLHTYLISDNKFSILNYVLYQILSH